MADAFSSVTRNLTGLVIDFALLAVVRALLAAARAVREFARALRASARAFYVSERVVVRELRVSIREATNVNGQQIDWSTVRHAGCMLGPGSRAFIA